MYEYKVESVTFGSSMITATDIANALERTLNIHARNGWEPIAQIVIPPTGTGSLAERTFLIILTYRREKREDGDTGNNE